MKGRMLASVVMTAIGASLLAAAMFASTAAGAGAVATAKKGGTITIVNRSDFDYVDPGLVWTGVKDTGKGGAMGLVGYENLTQPKSFHLREAI